MKSAVCAAVIFSALFFLFALKSIPVFRIWNSYKVVYADKSIPEKQVLDCLESAGCQDIISLGQQQVPLVSAFTPVLPESCNAYLNSRLGYFFDGSKSYLLYYVPNGSGQQILKSLERLSRETGLSAGIDGIQRYPFAVPIVCIAVFVFFVYLSVNRIPFFCAAFFFLLFPFSKPFYPDAAASVLCMLSCYLAQRIWNRRKALRVLKRNPYFIIPLAVSFLVAMLSGWQDCFLLVLCSAASCCLLFLFARLEAFIYEGYSFKPVKIFSAPQLPLMYAETAFHTLLCLAPLIVLLVCFIFAGTLSLIPGKSLSLPVPVDSGAESSIPSLRDFYSWAWNVETFPYRSLNTGSAQSMQDEGVVSIPRFEEKNGRIFRADSVVMKFNSEFKNRMDKKIDSLGYNAVEKLMLRQGENITVAYGSGERAVSRPDGFSAALILICVFVPVVLLLLYVLKSKRR
ncbi:hypothetical protein [Treponema sp.]|uniref:hypothetical protein n=1 Tax=Treponema sp. TaxID=166 RepID=UPI003F0F2C50